MQNILGHATESGIGDSEEESPGEQEWSELNLMRLKLYYYCSNYAPILPTIYTFMNLLIDYLNPGYMWPKKNHQNQPTNNGEVVSVRHIFIIKWTAHCSLDRWFNTWRNIASYCNNRGLMCNVVSGIVEANQPVAASIDLSISFIPNCSYIITTKSS